MSRLLILGANGMLGGSLLRYFSELKEYSVLGTVRTSVAQSAVKATGFDNLVAGVDVLDDAGLDSVIKQFKPNIIFNCIGLIKQVSAAKLPVPAIEINSLLPHKLATMCTNYGAKLIHFSTDCVFSGKVGLYKELDTPDATDIYGRSKLLGEVDYGGHLTLRTSIIGHELQSSVSLIDWFLSQQGSVQGFSKAIFSGMPTCYIAEFLHGFVLKNERFSGLYHLSVDPIDKYSLLSLVKKVYSVDKEITRNSDFKIDRSLNSNRLREELNFNPPSWTNLIEKMHCEYSKYFAK